MLTSKKKTFSDFTNLYSLSKTLRFELKPTEATNRLLKENNVVAIDMEIAQLYKEELKPMLDELHRRFIDDAMSLAVLPQNQLKEYCQNQLN